MFLYNKEISKAITEEGRKNIAEITKNLSTYISQNKLNTK